MDLMVRRGEGGDEGMSMTCGTGSSKELSLCSGMAYGMQSIPSHPQMEQQQTIHPSHQQYHVSFKRERLILQRGINM